MSACSLQLSAHCSGRVPSHWPTLGYVRCLPGLWQRISLRLARDEDRRVAGNWFAGAGSRSFSGDEGSGVEELLSLLRHCCLTSKSEHPLSAFSCFFFPPLPLFFFIDSGCGREG